MGIYIYIYRERERCTYLCRRLDRIRVITPPSAPNFGRRPRRRFGSCPPSAVLTGDASSRRTQNRFGGTYT